MKKTQMVSAGIAFVLAIAFISHAQMIAKTAQPIQTVGNLDLNLQAVETTTPLPARSVPPIGTFYSALAPMNPPVPGNFYNLPAWSLGDDVWLLDDLNQPQTQMMAADLPSPGDGGVSSDGGLSFQTQVFTTNDLWLWINSVSNNTANLTINAPWFETNYVYDLLYCTNLAPPSNWSWLLRTDPGQTNLIVPNATDAQGFYRLGLPNDLTANDSLGTDFWVVYINMYDDDPANQILSFSISSPITTTGTVSIPGNFTNTFSVAAGTVTNVAIPTGAMMTSYDTIGTNGIHITAAQPVSVYALNFYLADSAAFTCYPTPMLGTNYCVMAYYGGANGAPSEFAIVATMDNTTVTIMPSTNAALAGHSGTNSYNKTLQSGQTYQINSSSSANDVTGTFITSDKPVGVFAGVRDAYFPAGVPTANPLAQEQLPVANWGTQTLALGFALGTKIGATYRVLAANNNTVIFTNGIVAATNQAGMFSELTIAGPVEFQGSQPIQVAQFVNKSAFGGGTEGDPCEILLPPTGHYLETNIIFAFTNVSAPNPYGFYTRFDQNFLSIIVPQSVITNTLVDGLTVATTNFVPISTSGFFGAQISVTNGTHTVSSSQPVGVQAYGFGTYDAYGYIGGVVK